MVPDTRDTFPAEAFHIFLPYPRVFKQALIWVNMSYHETELLIMEIKRRPTIWDCTIDDYKNKIKKYDAWVEVCRAVDPLYDEKSDTEKKQILGNLQSRWKSIRDANNRSQKKLKGTSGSKARSSKKYVFADLLAFLQKITTNRETNDRLEMYIQDESFPQDQEDEQEELVRSLSPAPSAGSTSSSHNTRKTSRKRKINLEERMITFMDRCEEKDADRDFFNSMLPSVKTLTEDQKLVFRSEVIMALQRVKSGGLERPPVPVGSPYQYSFYPRIVTPMTSHLQSPSNFPCSHQQQSSAVSSDYVVSRPGSNLSHSSFDSNDNDIH